ncbi:hypothetical protein [Providencia alcalifaciens]|uniref:hypothetical protein n=1 Tax=Providencia alcalifaciens TaxID=126385 RepID=UPI001A93BEE6|nr:hypothetical protein [Providencia alcalifaciens]
MGPKSAMPIMAIAAIIGNISRIGRGGGRWTGVLRWCIRYPVFLQLQWGRGTVTRDDT